MFGSRKSRAREAQEVAEQAWEQLITAFESAGGAARSAGKRTQGIAGDAQQKVSAAAEEARWRAGAALDALAGRRQPRRWDLIAGAVLGGLVLGWFVAARTRRAMEALDSREFDPTVTKPLDSSVSPEF